MKSQKDDSLLTPAEVAALFRVDPKTVTRWAKAGKLSSIGPLAVTAATVPTRCVGSSMVRSPGPTPNCRNRSAESATIRIGPREGFRRGLFRVATLKAFQFLLHKPVNGCSGSRSRIGPSRAQLVPEERPDLEIVVVASMEPTPPHDAFE